MTFPHVRVSGGPTQRGEAYGEQARERIETSIAAYGEVFSAYTGWTWEEVRTQAGRYRAPIVAFDPRYMAEIEGIARGASVDVLDILAINVRTEVMLSAKARMAEASGRVAKECSAFAVLPSASADGHVLAGQNWDWLPHCHDTVVILEAEQDEGPNFVTAVEAGLLAKTGMNSSGIGVLTNALVTDEDRGEPGIPYHLLLRAFLDAETMSDALATAQRGFRSSSANYMLVGADGLAVDLEVMPGDYSKILLNFPADGVLLHTNHFGSPAFTGKDASLWFAPDSPFRLERLRQAVRSAGPALTLDTFRSALADHANYPSALCCHPDQRLREVDQSSTVVTVLMDLTETRMWVADGHPCEVPFRELEVDRLLSKESPIRRPA